MIFWTFLTQSPDLSDMACADDFASDWKRKRLDKGAHLARQRQTLTESGHSCALQHR